MVVAKVDLWAHMLAALMVASTDYYIQKKIREVYFKK